MAFLGGIGKDTVAEAQTGLKEDIATVDKELAPVFQLAQTVNSTLEAIQRILAGSKVTITIQLDNK